MTRPIPNVVIVPPPACHCYSPATVHTVHLALACLGVAVLTVALAYAVTGPIADRYNRRKQR